MSISAQKHSIPGWWQQLRPWFITLYFTVATVLLVISIVGQMRLIHEVGKVFGGFYWAIDTDSDGQIVVVSTPPQLPPFELSANSLSNNSHIVSVNAHKAVPDITHVYQSSHVGDLITYTVAHNDGRTVSVHRPTTIFTLDMWWQNYGLAFVAGLSWLLVGGFLLLKATEWAGAVEGITLLPPAMLLLLASHWGNVQQATPAGLVAQLLWIPSFALLGAAFIHLSLTYRPRSLVTTRTPHMMIDGLPYLPLVALVAYEWSSLLIQGHVPTRMNILFSLGYAVVGGLISVSIGLKSLIEIGLLLPRRQRAGQAIPARISQRIGDLVILWLGGIGLGFCLGALPLFLTGKTLLSLPTFFILAAVYPLILLYAIRSLRLIDRLHISLQQREEALNDQRKTAEALRRSNTELQRATSLLLHADAHLRSLLSQRIHDQPKQQALRIRSLLAYWQHKLRVEAEQETEGKVAARPIIEALGKVRKISEELESDLRGLQLLVEDAYQRRSLGLRLHLEKLITEDLPALHPESPLRVRADLWALDALDPNLEQSEEGTRIAEAISYTITQALLNVYNHAGATQATVLTHYSNGLLEVSIADDGRGFDPNAISPEKTSLFKAHLKAREANGVVSIQSVPRPHLEHGTKILLRIPLSTPHMQPVNMADVAP